MEPRAQLDSRREFTRKDAWRAYKLQGGVCKLCRRRIPFDLMHGDHIVPWIEGGSTTIKNLQALCGSCNLRKGRRAQEVIQAYFDVARLSPGMGELRVWQMLAMPIVMEAIGREPVLIEACPGAGKTRFGLEVAYRLVEAGTISRVLVVVPTLAIADGWLREASAAVRSAPTLPLHSQRDWRPVDPIADDWVGAVVTYQSLFAATDMFLAHATDPGQRTLVIFDEVHHAGADAAWGTAAQVAFAGGATAILSTTGTPFRTDRSPIVFVPSENGNAKPHYRYGYDDAIRDKACRPVQFVEARGQTTFRTSDGEVHTVSFDNEDLNARGEQSRLRAAIEWVGEHSIAEKMIADASLYLVALRHAGDADAAGLVVCIDCDHAAKVADFMATLAGRRPPVACSRLLDANDIDSANAIKVFRGSHDPWIVAVNMISEGVDIPRLRVVIYLTNRLTLLSFRQIVGRVVRAEATNNDDHGRVYLPADERLLEMAHAILQEARLLPPPVVILSDPIGPERVQIYGDAGQSPVPFESLETIGAQGGAFDTDGRDATALLIACARLFIQREGLVATDPESLALAAQGSPKLLEALMALRDQM